ncbi:MAG: hydantoinase B/oxoprolinase family protein [Chloroflexi bacterium]|nr:hydantoinase B/oxoprolinase family protein [Chloroflexota bacterium]
MVKPLDPVTFEVLRHRLWAINDESATALRITSGSTVANEVRDMNTTLLNAEGEALLMGPYIASHAIGQHLVVKWIVKEYWDNPGINEGDVFICNDPYVGVPHQNDVACVSPIHWNGELVAWTGATIHQIDVGGPVRGSQGSVGSQSIFGEALPMPPLKIIEKGTYRRDIENEYLIRSRTRELNALDLKAKIASNNVAKSRILQLIKQYGLDTVKAVMGEIINLTTTQLKARLREFPDGTWRHTSFIDYFDGTETKVYPCRLAMTKRGDSLTFDFTETAKQAPAVMNCTYSGLMTGVVIAVLSYLCHDIPWSPAGVMGAIRIVSKPGTLVHASWPAGCAKATTAGSYVVTTATTVCLAKMMASSDEYRDSLMAPWTGVAPTQELFGVDQRGEEFGVTMLDSSMGGGGGARSYKDGIDTGGIIRSLSASMANVETYEFRYPILYLHRRQEHDTGGPGRFRGGAAMSTVFIPHDVELIPTNVMHTYSYEQPEAVGVSGGYPAGTALYEIKRNSNIWELMGKGVIPQSLEEVAGTLEVPPAMSVSYLRRGDVYRCMSCGGGGYGDPLDRDPGLVLRDVERGLVSSECAQSIYGVSIHPDKVEIDVEGTNRQRQALRKERATLAKKLQD